MGEFVLGWEEWVALPELGLPALRAKTDTGAKTSALHARAIEPFGPIEKPRVRFLVQPWPERPDVELVCAAPFLGLKEVTSSNGETELRHFISTRIRIGGREWETTLSLADRSRMRYRMLLGRAALGEHVRIDPSRSFLQSELSYDLYAQASTAEVRRPLRIALLTQDPGNYSCRALIAAAERRDHVIEALETRACAINVNADRPEVVVDGKALPHFDAVIPRIGAGITQYGCAVVRQFEATGAYVLNSAAAIAASRDKLATHQILTRAGVAMPITAVGTAGVEADQIIAIVGGAPLVVKLIRGSQGRGVVLAETPQAARSVIGAFQDLDAEFLVQEFVAEAQGADIRLVVVGGKVAAAMKRQARAGDFRSNLHRGGTASVEKPSKEEREIAVRAARIMGLDVAGVDLLRTQQGPKILEVNSSPGLQGIERATQVDVAGAIIAHIERRLRPHLVKRKAAA
jgi:ribosomal protein S6--L-glutamate ligase